MITMHPGEYLRMAYIEPENVTQREISTKLGISPAALSRLLNGHSELSADMALKLESAFGRSAESWLVMQMRHSLAAARKSFQTCEPAQSTI